MYRLHVVPAHGDPFDRLLDGDSLVIGRSSEADLMIADRFLSRKHARLYLDGDDWWAEDLGSRNGTLLNGKEIEGAAKIAEGDELRLCGSVISVESVSAARRRRESNSARDLGSHTVFRRASDLIDSQPDTAGDTDAPDALRRYAARLKMLNDVHHTLSGSIELQDLLDLILDRAFEHLRPEEGAIFLKRDGEGFYRAAFRGEAREGSDATYSTTLIREVAEKGMAALVLDVETDDRFAEARSILSSGIRSLVAAPLIEPEGALGMIALSSRAHVRRFDEDDMELLVSLASVAAMRLRNIALAVEAAERRRLQEELALARQIQVALLPAALPEIPGYALHGGNLPSRGVSGDLYEVIERPAGDVVLFVADVSGKGIAAAFLTAALEALTAGPIEVGQSPDEICSKASRRLFQRTPPAKYATGFLATLEPASGRLSYTNAGHNPGLIVRVSGDVEELGPTGMPIGLMPSAEYGCRTETLAVGDTLVLYTDGITEAEDPDDEEFGAGRLTEVCRAHRALAPDELGSRIEEALSEFVRGEPFADDRTLVVVRRTGES